ncbi:MAG: bifunctional phosphoribosylaminoimidazolecarboxamide formyltransferase/IMP cyclohydrolase [Acidimicrobiales bacterium]
MRALFSVYDKSGLVAFATGLRELGWELIASGGTAEALGRAGVAHRDVAAVTGAPEMLDGRVKTLHPAIHGGILADRSKPAHLADLAARGIEPIDLVACNLYPFSSSPSVEMIDVGGPTMVRAAAKNHAHVAVVVDPADYAPVLDEIRAHGVVTAATRRRLAEAAFAHTSAYDAAIARWLASPGPAEEILAESIELVLTRREKLRYGENPHQAAARYGRVGGGDDWWEHVTQQGGRELSFINLVDAEAAWLLCHDVLDVAGANVAAVIVKHANPCGVAVGSELGAVYARAFEGDPVSAYGGIVALSGRVDAHLAEAIVANPLADVLVAYGYEPDALGVFAARRKNMRVLTAPVPSVHPIAFRQFSGGFLVQQRDLVGGRSDRWRVVTARQPTAEQWRDAEFAWRVCARTTSNAIVLAIDGQVVGVGCGQQNRRDAARLAGEKAAGRAVGGAGASDAFFPFRDGLDAVCDAGVAVVVQPGGSLHDEAMIAVANERGVAMVLTGERHFRH